MVSRTKPNSREASVAPPTLVNCLMRLMGRGSTAACSRSLGLWCACLVETDGFQKRPADAVLPRLGGDLMGGQIGDVEGIDDPLAKGGNVGRGDIQAELGHAVGQVVKQPMTVEALHFDDREAIRQLVGDGDL